MKRIDTAVWAPADGMELEDRALEAVKAVGNVLVIAGPGAGKTELLAQKAGYLLLTGGCRMPRRILAISFKRDAARNLGERVEKRIGPLLAKRFHSVTFDAFAKGLLDKFRSGLPTPYQIGANYEIMEQPKNAIENAFRAADQQYFMTHRLNYQDYLSSVPLPHAIEQGRGMEVLHQAWLNLTAKTIPEVNFQMIMRLAGLILDTNPTLRHYLQLTYSHVFLDEFQDTTELQFQFLNTCFHGSAAIFTAVGDDKQRIMGWAGAKANIFETFVAQTAATPIALTRNFRSLPKLVSLQNYLMERVLGKTDFATAASDREPEEGEASILLFSNDTYESNYLATTIEKWVIEDGIDPRKICVLVRATLKDYAATLIGLLNSRGIAARDENELQNLLSEDIIIFLLRVISLVVGPGDYRQMQQALDIIIKLYPEKRDDQLLKLRKDLQDFIKARKAVLSEGAASEEDLKRLVDAILDHGGIDRMKAVYPQFSQGKYFDDTIKQFTEFLWAYYEDNGDMLAAVASLEGDDTIPVMTIHKSKGLEFHTVVFIGLEDQTFWNYTKETEADNNVFFVALSRAKERVIFTFSEHRPGMHVRSQYRSWENIIQIYTAMHDSNVVNVHDFRITQ